MASASGSAGSGGGGGKGVTPRTSHHHHHQPHLSPYGGSSHSWDDRYYHSRGSRSPSSPGQQGGGIHFSFERQNSVNSVGSRGGASPLIRSPHLSPSYYRGMSGGMMDDGTTSDYRPAVPLPLLSGAGPEAIPDFLKLMDEANERSGGLRSLRGGPVLSWDDVSAQLERPKGAVLIEEVDQEEGLGTGKDVEDEEDEEEEEEERTMLIMRMMEEEEQQPAGGGNGMRAEDMWGRKTRELMGLWALQPRGSGDRVLESSDSSGEEEEEGQEEEEGDGQQVAAVRAWGGRGGGPHIAKEKGEQEETGVEDALHDYEGLSISGSGGGEGTSGPKIESRFHPLGQVIWEKNIQWGTVDDEEEDDEEEDEEEDGGEEAQQQQEIVAAEKRGGGGRSMEVEEDDAEEGEEGEIEDPEVLLQKRRAEAKRRRRAWRKANRERARATAATTTTATGFSLQHIEQETEKVLRAPFPLNVELNGLRWTNNIIWDRRKRPPSAACLPLSRLILDRNDPQIFFNPPPLPRTNLESLGLMGLRKETARVEVVRIRTITIPTIEHAECAIRHETSITDPRRICLSEEARYFHRPRLGRMDEMCWALRPVKERGPGGKGGRLASQLGVAPKPIKTSRDLGAYEGEIVLIEYSEERPPLLSNPGMASKLINLWRLSKEDLAREQTVAGGGGGSGGSSSAAAGGEGGKKMGSSSSKLARITREDLAANDIAMDLDTTHAGVPEFAQGQTIVLYPEDSCPFLGQIEDQMRQIALFTNMFKAPLFEHSAKPTDFLLVRAPPQRVRDPPQGEQQGETECYAVREIPRIYLCGQMEPLIEVLHPDDPRFKDFRDKLFRFALAIKLSSQGDHHHFGGDKDEHERRVSLVDLVRLFDAFNELLPESGRDKEREKEALVMFFLRGIARELTGKHQGQWTLNASTQLDELTKDITPEEVCMYESMVAGIRRLLDEGISIVGKVLSFAPSRIEPILARNLQSLLRDRQARAERARRSAGVLKGSPRAAEAEEVASRLKTLYEEVRQLISVGAFILDEIQLTPWYLTHHYQAIHIEKAYGGMFKLSGLGDPSGIGEGFSYLPRQQREPGRSFKEVLPTLDQKLQDIIGDVLPFRMGVSTMNEILKYVWANVSTRRMAQHRLSTAGYETELEELLRLNRAPKKLRVQVVLDIDTGEVRTGAGVQEYIRTCNFIWNKQVNALSDLSGQFGDEEGLMEIDLDEGGVGAGEKRANGRNGGGASGNEGLQVETEEDAEAVQKELRERAAAVAQQRADAERRQAAMAGRPSMAWLKPKQVVKRLIKEVDVDGTERYRVEFVFAPQDVERVKHERVEKLEQLRKEVRAAQRRGTGENKLVLAVSDKVKKRKRPTLTLPSISSLKKMDKEAKERLMNKKKAKSDAEKQLYERKFATSRRDVYVPKQRGVPGRRGRKPNSILGGGSSARAPLMKKPHFTLNMRLDEIYSKAELAPFAKPFKRLKGRSMDLERIKRKLTDYRYASRQEMLDDFATIAAEADPSVGEYAKAVQAEVIRGITRLDDQEMAELENEIAIKNAASLKKKKKKMEKKKLLEAANTIGGYPPPPSSSTGGGGGAAASNAYYPPPPPQPVVPMVPQLMAYGGRGGGPGGGGGGGLAIGGEEDWTDHLIDMDMGEAAAVPVAMPPPSTTYRPPPPSSSAVGSRNRGPPPPPPARPMAVSMPMMMEKDGVDSSSGEEEVLEEFDL